MRILALVVPLGLLACSGDDEPAAPATKTDDTETATIVDAVDSGISSDTASSSGPTDSGTETVCLNSLLSRFPANGTTDAFFATSVEFEINVIEADATVEVSGPDGIVPGTSEVLGRRVRWTADDPLAADTTYTGTLRWSCAPETTTFTTSATGPTVDLAAIDGQAYRLDLVSARWLQPGGLGAAIPLLLAADLLIGVESNDAEALDLTFARTQDFGQPQDLCSPTTAFPTASFANNPLFSVGPADVGLEVDGAALPVYGLELSGAFSADGTLMEGGRLAGLADLSALSSTLLGSSDPTAICNLLATFNVSCLSCPSSAAATCVQIEVDSIRGTQDPQGVVTRTAADVAADCY